MRSETAIKIVLVLGLLSVVGAAIAAKMGTAPLRIAEQVGYLWVLAAIFLLEPIASQLFPRHVSQIAIGVAVLSAAIGALCIVLYSTEHVANSLFTVGMFWQISEDLLMHRSMFRLWNKSHRELYQHFKATNTPRPPLAQLLANGSIALFLASIACLFTITTW